MRNGNLLNSCISEIWISQGVDALFPKFCIYILHISMIISAVLNCCVLLTCWIVFHLESSCCIITIRLKTNPDLIAWRDMTGRNWIITILSYYGWCTWIPIINGQGIKAEKTCCLFLLYNIHKPSKLTRNYTQTQHQKI